jgi:penicillin-binding protein 1C
VRDGAILVVENRTGNVLAYVSHSSGSSRSGQVDGIQAKRQAGSTLKPLLYAHAFDRHVLTPASILDDTPLDLSVVNGIYQPRNYDSEFKGHVTARVALASSLNVPAVKTLSLVGNESFLRVMRQAGVKGLKEAGDFYGPSLALGSADVSLWELTNAYRSLANHGEWSDLHLAPEAKSAGSGRRIFTEEAAFLISDILSDREARSSTFGLENPLATRYWTAVKTGTSKDMRDNWCIGYSQKYTVGVWVGNFSGDPMWNVSGITGAAPLWVEMMNCLHRIEPSRGGRPPANVVSRKVKWSQGVESREKEWFIRGTEPRSADRKVFQLNQGILYPPRGAIIAVDPDIPPEVQRVFFVSQIGGEGLQWVLNGNVLGETGKTVSWSPQAGSYVLAMLDPDGNVLDSVHFEVRGPAEE